MNEIIVPKEEPVVKKVEEKVVQKVEEKVVQKEQFMDISSIEPGNELELSLDLGPLNQTANKSQSDPNESIVLGSVR
jgi:hypothetical protein